METNEQKIARLCLEMDIEAAAYAAAQDDVARLSNMLDKHGGTATAALIAAWRTEWRQRKTDELLASARFELALQRWLAAQL